MNGSSTSPPGPCWTSRPRPMFNGSQGYQQLIICSAPLTDSWSYVLRLHDRVRRGVPFFEELRLAALVADILIVLVLICSLAFIVYQLNQECIKLKAENAHLGNLDDKIKNMYCRLHIQNTGLKGKNRRLRTNNDKYKTTLGSLLQLYSLTSILSSALRASAAQPSASDSDSQEPATSQQPPTSPPAAPESAATQFDTAHPPESQSSSAKSPISKTTATPSSTSSTGWPLSMTTTIVNGTGFLKKLEEQLESGSRIFVMDIPPEGQIVANVYAAPDELVAQRELVLQGEFRVGDVHEMLANAVRETLRDSDSDSDGV